jgi:hypothetical protein
MRVMRAMMGKVSDGSRETQSEVKRSEVILKRRIEEK